MCRCNEIDYEIDPRGEAATKEEAAEDEGAASSRKKSRRGKKQHWKHREPYQGTQVVPTSLQSTEKMMPNYLPPSADPSVPVLRVAEVSATGVSIKEEPREGGGKRKAEAPLESSKTKLAAPPAWFSRDSISSKERLLLSEFFDGSMPHLNESVFKQLRTSICNEYTVNPHVYLSATSCRKKISMDIRAILAVHDFLDSHGIINYAVEAIARPARMNLLLAPSDSDIKPISTEPRGAVPSSLPPELRDQLLDAVSKCDVGDWDAVAMQLEGQLTPAECLRQFAALPLDFEPKVSIPPVIPTEPLKSEEVKRNLLLEYMTIRMQTVEEKVQLKYSFIFCLFDAFVA